MRTNNNRIINKDFEKKQMSFKSIQIQVYCKQQSNPEINLRFIRNVIWTKQSCLKIFIQQKLQSQLNKLKLVNKTTSTLNANQIKLSKLHLLVYYRFLLSMQESQMFTLIRARPISYSRGMYRPISPKTRY